MSTVVQLVFRNGASRTAFEKERSSILNVDGLTREHFYISARHQAIEFEVPDFIIIATLDSRIGKDRN